VCWRDADMRADRLYYGYTLGRLGAGAASIPYVTAQTLVPTRHYQRGTLVESRPYWQLVPLPGPALPPTSPDEHYHDPESLCQPFLFQSP